MPLQTDPTVLYAKGLETRSDPKNITKDDLLKDNIYNTYRQRGPSAHADRVSVT